MASKGTGTPITQLRGLKSATIGMSSEDDLNLQIRHFSFSLVTP